MKNYYSRVVEDLLKYKENKQRCIVIAKQLDDKLEAEKGIDYSQVNSKTNNIYDGVGETVIDRLDSELAEEFRAKRKKVIRIEVAFEGLDPVEKFIIKRKYLSGRIEKDVNIYTHPQFEPGKTRYYEIKDRAVAKLARIIGYIQEKNEIEQLVND